MLNIDEYLTGDWNGDSVDDLAIRQDFRIFMDYTHDGIPDLIQEYGRGNNEDEYLVGDWDGDGRDNLAVRRGFEVLMDTNFDNEDDLLQLYGRDDNQDEYLVGDWDGDGRDNLAVLRGFEVLMDTNFDNEHDFIHTLDLNAGGDTIEEASSVSVASDGKTYAGLVSSDNPNDYFSFSLGAENEFTLSLDSLSADADVQVLDLDGNVVLSGTNAGTTAESISDTLDAGAYRLRVFSADNEETAYNLDLAVTPNIEEIDGITITTTGSDAVFGLDIDDSSQLINLDDFRSGDPNLGSIPEFAGIDGSGFSAVIIDSGIDLDHPFFGEDTNNDDDDVADRIVYHQDFANNDMEAEDNDGHGTHVSSIVASEDDIFTGVAPGANIIHLKAWDNDTDNSPENVFARVEQALQWVVTNVENFNIASVNMSFSQKDRLGSIPYTEETTLSDTLGIDDELAALNARGVIVVSTAGNSFTRTNQQNVAYPAADPNTLAVGSVGDGSGGTTADQISGFSQRDANLTDIFAPGQWITAANVGGGTIAKQGTSMAAPHITGMAVLAQQLKQQANNTQLSPDEFGQLLYDTGTPINDPVTGVTTFRRADMLALAQEIVPTVPPIVPPIFLPEIDLSGTRFDIVQSELTTGDSFNINFQVQNSGTDDAESFDVNFYLSENDNITQNDFLLGDFTVNLLAGNSNTGTLAQTLNLPDSDNPIWAGFGSGEGYIGMIIDAGNTVAETNENNNTNTGLLDDYDRVDLNQTGTLTAKINRVKGDFDSLLARGSDFYSRISIDGEEWKSGKRNNDNDYRPSNWEFSQNVTGVTVPVTIKLFDDDGGLFNPFNDDDHIDIDPDSGDKDLELVYNLFTGDITGDATTTGGEEIYSKGGGDSNRGEIWLTVDFAPVRVPT